MKERAYPKIMVAISTQQNSTNLLPFLQLGCSKMLLLETDFAREKGWKDGICKVIQGKQYEVEVIPLGIGDDLSDILRRITEVLKDEDSVIYNIGGGQKMQQIGLQHIFQQRVQQGMKDIASYTIPQNKKTYIISYKSDGVLESVWQITDVFLNLEETTVVFSHEPSGKNMKLLWDREHNINVPASSITEADAAWLIDYEKRQEMFTYTLALDRGQQVGDPPFPQPFTKFADYFEAVAQYQITNILTACPNIHCVNQIWANVRLRNLQTGVETAEYDILLVTNYGTFLPIDAKSYDFLRKDEQARILNLERASGQYTKFWSVFPYFTEDLEEQSILKREHKWLTLLKQPFVMQQRGSSMLTLSNKNLKNIYLKKGKKDKIISIDKEAFVKIANKKYVLVNTLENILPALGLGRLKKEL